MACFETEACCCAPDLPVLVLTTIFTFLDGDTRSLCCAACVSRSWYSTSRQPVLWSTLDFSKSFHAIDLNCHVTAATLRALLNLAGRELGALGSRYRVNSAVRSVVVSPSHIVTPRSRP